MTRTARVWIKGGREHDEEICFQDAHDLFQQLEEMRARWQLGFYKLQVHGIMQTSHYPRVIQGDVELDMLPVSTEGASLHQQQQEIGAHLREAEQTRKIYEQIKRQRMEDDDRKNQEMAEAQASLDAEEQERLSNFELELAQYKAAVGECFASIGTVTSQCFGGSRRRYHKLRKHHD